MAKNTFEINGKEYDAIPFTFNTVCELEDVGFSMEDLDKKPASAVRAYFALCCGDVTLAGNEIEAHLIGGGDMSSIMAAMTKEIEESGFFKAMAQQTNTAKVPQDHQKPKSTATKPKK